MLTAQDTQQMIQLSIQAHGLTPATLVIEKELPGNWHGDLHFKITVDDLAYYIRFLNNERFGKSNSLDLYEDRLAEQVRFCDHLVSQGVPFMRRLEPLDGSVFVPVTTKDRKWKCLLFEWVEGVHLTANTQTISYRFGQMARKFHDVSIGYHAPDLAVTVHTDGYTKHLNQLRDCLHTHPVPADSEAVLHEYITLAEQNIAAAYRHEIRDELRIITSDLNSLNVLWDERTETINGIVDFEHIAWSDRVQELAWLMKWYSRTEGIGSHKMSPELAHAVLDGYGAWELLTNDDFSRLPALLWLSGCLNFNTIAKTIELVEGGLSCRDHLTKYLLRGEKLVGLYNPATQ